MEQKNFSRGDIIFVDNSINHIGCEQGGGRPAVVISNDRFNRSSGVLGVVYLTSRVKKPMESHVIVRSGNHYSTALCEQIYTLAKSRISSIFGHCTPCEMAAIDAALHYSLALE